VTLDYLVATVFVRHVVAPTRRAVGATTESVAFVAQALLVTMGTVFAAAMPSTHSAAVAQVAHATLA
jgi:hypothetical protein